MDFASLADERKTTSQRKTNTTPVSDHADQGQKRSHTEKSESRIVKRAKRNDLREILEHVMVVGNFHRHRHWRRKEYGKETLSSAPESQITDSGGKNGDTEGTASQPMMINVEDTLIYGQSGSRSAGSSVICWPNPPDAPQKRTGSETDDQWGLLWGDDVDPISFSEQRLSSHSHELLNHEGNPRKDWLHPSCERKSISPAEATRSILLKCWDRAVHAASKTLFLQCSASYPSEVHQYNINKFSTNRPPKSPEVGSEKAGFGSGKKAQSRRTEGVDAGDFGGSGGSLSNSISSFASPAQSSEEHEATQHIAANHTRRSGLDGTEAIKAEKYFSAQRARTECQNLGIALCSASPGSGSTYLCPVCRANYESFARLETHYYGGSTVRGCSWVRIMRCKESVVRESLEAEVSLQATQLARAIAVRSINTINRLRGLPGETDEPPYKYDLFRPALDWHHIQHVLSNLMSLAVYNNESSSETSNTLDVMFSLSERQESTTALPPMLLNWHTLEAALNRLHERYTNIER